VLKSKNWILYLSHGVLVLLVLVMGWLLWSTNETISTERERYTSVTKHLTNHSRGESDEEGDPAAEIQKIIEENAEFRGILREISQVLGMEDTEPVGEKIIDQITVLGQCVVECAQLQQGTFLEVIKLFERVFPSNPNENTDNNLGIQSGETEPEGDRPSVTEQLEKLPSSWNGTSKSAPYRDDVPLWLIQGNQLNEVVLAKSEFLSDPENKMTIQYIHSDAMPLRKSIKCPIKRDTIEITIDTEKRENDFVLPIFFTLSGKASQSGNNIPPTRIAWIDIVDKNGLVFTWDPSARRNLGETDEWLNAMNQILQAKLRITIDGKDGRSFAGTVIDLAPLEHQNK